MKNIAKKLFYVVAFLGFFLLFLFLTFPFGLIKESLEQHITQALGKPVTIEQLSLSLPLGVHVKGLRIAPNPALQSSSDHTLHFHTIRLKVHVWPLLIGRFQPSCVITQGHNQELTLSTSLSWLKLLQGPPVVPAAISIQAQNFALTAIIHHALNFYIQSPHANPLITPLLQQISFKGHLQGDISLQFPQNTLSSLNGDVDITLLELSFESQDPNLVIPEQRFSPARLKAQAQNGTITIHRSSEFISRQLAWGLRGTVTLRPQFPLSMLDVHTSLKMGGNVLDQLGVIVQMALLKQEEWNGEALLHLQGPLAAPKISHTMP